MVIMAQSEVLHWHCPEDLWKTSITVVVSGPVFQLGMFLYSMRTLYTKEAKQFMKEMFILGIWLLMPNSKV